MNPTYTLIYSLIFSNSIRIFCDVWEWAELPTTLSHNALVYLVDSLTLNSLARKDYMTRKVELQTFNIYIYLHIWYIIIIVPNHNK